MDEIDSGFLALIAGAAYIIGLLSFNFLFLNYQISEFELLKTVYIFAGAYYFIFYFLLIQFPIRRMRNLYIRIGYYFLSCIVIYLLNKGHQNYFWYLVGCIFSLDNSSYAFEADIIGIMVVDFIMITICTMFCVLLFEAGIKEFKETSGKKGAGLILLSIPISLLIYSYFILPMIPKVIGGGKPPLVRLEFTDNTPYKISMHFDISRYTKGGYSHYARLIHISSGKLFLMPAAWYNNSVFEIDEKYIDLIEYDRSNPAEMGFHKP
ncbi:MAG: hypothetical protein AB7S40_09965 [Bacteroidales bacterium]